MTRRSLLFSAAVCGLLLAPLRPAAAEVLPDSTITDGWRLANGLEVRVRHIPGATGVVITTGYRSGLLDDAAGREGQSELLTHLYFYSAAGDIPDRTREEMDSQRPMGWKVSTTQRITALTEVASLAQFPGVLRQVAIRMRGVSVTQAGLSAAVDTVRRDLASRTFGVPAHGLYWRVHALAEGVADDALMGRASARGLAGLKLKDVGPLMQARFVPANACLALAGDFSNMNIRTLVEREFGSIPAGTARPDAPPVVLHGGERVSVWPGLDRAVGVVGIVAPALDDTLHPSFYLAGLMVGLQLRKTSGNPPPTQPGRFQYSVYDEPELFRLYPDVPPAETSPAALGSAIEGLTAGIGNEIITISSMDNVRRGWAWLLGGPMPDRVRQQAIGTPGMLTPLTAGMVTRALWRGDAFWALYRHRFETTSVAPSSFLLWLQDPANQARLLLVPKK